MTSRAATSVWPLLLLLIIACGEGPWALRGCSGSPSKDHDGHLLKRQACEPSVTTVNGKQACSKRLLFEDNFDGPTLHSGRWKADNQIAGAPDYEFAWFTDDRKNLFLHDGLLFLKPTLVSAANNFLTAGTLDLRNKGCTSDKDEECHQSAASFNILPPVASARVRSKDKFSFRYGVVELRAKLPDGFWLYPEIYLEPAKLHYGAQHSGRVVLAMARGNARLRAPDGSDAGARRLQAGLELELEQAAAAPSAAHTLRTKDLPPGAAWNADFHTFRLVWTPEGVTIEVDQEQLLKIDAPPFGFQQLVNNGNAWSEGDNMAPFDREFYVTLGLGVGGSRAFPDNTTSAGRAKPWKNGNVKARITFLQDKKTWRDTWAFDDAALQVDYIKVWAL